MGGNLMLLDKELNIHLEKGIYAKKGQIIKCPWCHKEIYQFSKDIYYGDVRVASDVIAINNFKQPVDGETTDCPNCGKDLWL